MYFDVTVDGVGPLFQIAVRMTGKGSVGVALLTPEEGSGWLSGLFADPDGAATTV